MVSRRPLVTEDGLVSELLQGDTVQTGGSSNEVIAGSGLVGGGVIGPNTRLDFAVAANPSGVIYVGDSIGNDGVSFVNATNALSSGNAALADSVDALASGNAALTIGAEALASGNAALGLVPALGGGSNTAVIEAASAVASGVPVGVDDTGRLQAAESYFEATDIDFGAISAFTTEGIQNDNYGPGTNIAVITGTNQAVCITRQSAGGYLKAVVGTWNGTSWSYGTWQTIASVNINLAACCWHQGSSRLFIVSGQFSGTTGTHNYLCSVSGGTVTIEEDTSVTSSYPDNQNCFYLPDVDRVLAAYDAGGSRVYLYSISGNTSTQEAFASSSQTGSKFYTFYDQGTGIPIQYYESSNNHYLSTWTVTANSLTQNSWTSAFSTRSRHNIGVDLASIGDRQFVFLISEGIADPVPIYGYIGTINATGTTITVGAEINTGATGYYVRCPVSFTDVNGFSFGSGGVSDSSFYLYSLRKSGSSLTLLDTSPNLANAFFRVYTSQFKLSTGDPSYCLDISGANSSMAIASGIGSQVNTPTLNGQSNILGIADSTVASGTDCTVVLPGSLYNNPNASYTPGKFYYADVATSGLTETTTQPATWSGAVPWNYLGKAVTTSGLLLINSL